MSNILAEIFSAGNRAKRKLGGLLSDPAGTIALGSQRMAEDTNLLSRLASEAGYMPRTVNRADQSVLVSPQQQALARALLADKGAEMGMAAATVWHGSPHKFDKFDSSKIGTGEGAQAYGHGLYLAESPDVAQNYADYVKRVTPTQLKDAKSLLLQMETDNWRRFKPGDIEAQKQLVEKMANRLESKSLYKVDLPDNAIARMLDYDKPLHRQAPEVRKAVRGVVEETLGPGAYGGLIKNRPDIKDLQNNILETMDPAQIAAALRSKGVPGIRYLDQASRNSGGWHVTPPSQTVTGKWMVKSSDYNSKGMHFNTEAEARAELQKQLGSGTRNFVVFPGQEDILKILERNGVPIK